MVGTVQVEFCVIWLDFSESHISKLSVSSHLSFAK